MSSTYSIKRHNHKVHPCEAFTKENLLKHLISFYENKTILVLSKANTTTTEIEDKNLTLSNDAELSKMNDRKWDVLISFDLPKSAEEYMKRLPFTKTMALLLVTAKEESLLYPIETILGKNLPREMVPGFEVRKVETKVFKEHRPTQSQKRSEEEEKAKEREKKERYAKEDSQRNHKFDGTTRSEEEKRSAGKPQYLKDSDKDRKEKKSFGKKEWDKPKGDKKPFEKKSWDKPQGDKKPWENKSPSNDYRNKKETTHTSSQPKRVPRVIKIPTEKPSSKES